MGWDGRELVPLDERMASQLREKAPELVFSEGEEVTVKGVVFTVSLVDPPRIVLKAKRTAPGERLAASAALVGGVVKEAKRG